MLTPGCGRKLRMIGEGTVSTTAEAVVSRQSIEHPRSRSIKSSKQLAGIHTFAERPELRFIQSLCVSGVQDAMLQDVPEYLMTRPCPGLQPYPRLPIPAHGWS
jgi:hypothetical protein